MNGSSLLVYDEGYLDYDFGGDHSMRQGRIKLARELIAALGILSNPRVEEVAAETAHEEILFVHSEDYVEAVKVAGRDPGSVGWQYMQYGLGTTDNPVFEDMYEASALHVGGSLKASRSVLSGQAAHAFNLGGGFHHALRSRASGFCIFNDPAIAIRVLLQQGLRRVLYVDVDSHHGDGVQAAFYREPAVMTISLHEDGRYLFPGTGFIEELGEGEGEGYSVNVPLPPYTDDEAYMFAFRELVPALAEVFKPEFVVTQFGVDTHFLDPLTHMSLTTGAHHQIGVEMHRLVHGLSNGRWVSMGGGGYDPAAVARSWALMFGAMVEWDVEDRIPEEWSLKCEEMIGRTTLGHALIDPQAPSKPGIQRKVEGVVHDVKAALSPYHPL